MPVPLAISLPAAAAGLAYLNARFSLSYDGLLLRSVLRRLALMTFDSYRGKLNIFYHLESRAKSRSSAHRSFLRFEDKRYTYAETYTRVLQYGIWLREKLGIKPADVVAVDFMNSDLFVFVWLGLWSIGAKPAFINYNLRGQALVHCVKTAKAKILIVDRRVTKAISPDVREGLPGVRIDIFSDEIEADVLALEPVRYPDDVRPQEELHDMACLVYTSGTTGMPKAAVVSWGKVHFGGGLTALMVGMKPTDVFYTCMPLYHSSALVMAAMGALAAGGTIALGTRFSTKTFWADVRRHDATMIHYVGEALRYLVAASPERDPATGENLDRKHQVRLAFGNGLRPDVWNRFKERFGIETILEFYSATEATMATFNLSRNDFSMGAVGRNGLIYSMLLGPAVKLAALDPDTETPRRDPETGFCRKVPAGEPGELLLKVPAEGTEKRFQGYYGNEKATADKVLRDVFKKGDAWFRTGDIMRWDSDGRLYFQDRIGDTFRWKSENVSTTDVAHVVSLHQDVHEANIYGVQVPHHDGRAGCAALVLSREPSRELLADFARHVTAGLPRYARPLFLRIMKDVGAHTTGTHKQQKQGLRREGIAPDNVSGDRLFWFRDGTYEEFGPAEWAQLSSGGVKM